MIGVLIHKETAYVATFVSNKQKCHIFPFVFSLFFSTKLENRMEEQILPRCMWERWYQWEGEKVGKGVRRVKTAQKMCTHVCKFKNDTCEN
jgi:hypothetical protein